MVDDYTVDLLGRCLAQWMQLRSLAEGVRSTSAIRTGGRSSAHSGGREWADQLADIEKAWSRLRFNSLGQRIVEARMQGFTCSKFAATYHLRKADVLEAYRTALVEMVDYLEGVTS